MKRRIIGPIRGQERIPIVFGENILRLRERIRKAPQQPGVYRWLNRTGQIIYIGKAKNLRKRLQTYVTGSHAEERVFKRTMWEEMWDLDLTVTNTELEALILEMHLIRKMKPKYNVALTRDRQFVYVRIGVQEVFPSIAIVRTRGLDGAQYYGPFTNPYGQERMLELLRVIFPFRTCRMDIRMKDPLLFGFEENDEPFHQGVRSKTQGARIDGQSFSHPNPNPNPNPLHLDIVVSKPDRRVPCFDHHIKRCTAPCDGRITPEAYRSECIDGVLEFYSGHFGSVVDRLIGRMQQAQGERKFERAHDILRALRFIQNLQQQHVMLGMVSRATDVLGISCKKRTAYISLLQIRGGNIVNEVSLKVRTKKGSEGDALQEFLVEYYSEASSIPDRLLLPFQLPEHRTIKAWFADKRADCVLTCSKRGQDGRLIKLAQSNAEKKIEAELVKRSVAYTMLKNEMSSQNKTTMDTSDIVNS